MIKNDKEREDFVQQYLDLDLSDVEPSRTDWEGRASTHSVSPLALKRYLRFLEILKYILMVIFALAIAVVVGLSFKFLLLTKFEIIVFDDGTNVTCILDPSTGDIKQNDK